MTKRAAGSTALREPESEPHRAPEPDVAFVHRRCLHLAGERDMRGAPDVAIAGRARP